MWWIRTSGSICDPSFLPQDEDLFLKSAGFPLVWLALCGVFSLVPSKLTFTQV